MSDSSLHLATEHVFPVHVGTNGSGFALGIRGLPQVADGLLPGELYSLNIETASSRLNLISQILWTNLAQGYTCALITPLSPHEFLGRCEAQQGMLIKQAVAESRLFIFTMIGDYAKNIFRFGPGRFLSELKQQGLPEHSLLLVDQADALFTLQDSDIAVEQAKAYRHWMRQTSCTALLLFLRATGNAPFAAYQALTDYFSGAARFAMSRGATEFSVEFWYAPAGTMTSRLIPLEVGSDGCFQVVVSLSVLSNLPAQANLERLVSSIEGHSDNLLPAQDETHVYYLGDDLLPLTSQATERWTRVTSLIGMLHATREARAALILITVSKNMEMRELAEAVHALRMTLGTRVRIVIREIGISLRYHNELLLLQLGANIVIHRNVALARIPLILQSLHGQSYRQKRQIGFEDAVESVNPSQSKGYLSPFYFHEEVQTVLREAQALSVPCAMVLLEHSAGLTAQDALQRFQLSRVGDLLTATSHHCYLFLYGCPASNVPEVLSRLLGAYAAQGLENAECHTNTAAISAVLAQLRQCATAGTMSDLSADWADFSFNGNEYPVTCEDNAINSSALLDSSVPPLNATPMEITAAPSEASPLPAMPQTAEVVIPFYREPAPRARRRYG